MYIFSFCCGSALGAAFGAGHSARFWCCGSGRGGAFGVACGGAAGCSGSAGRFSLPSVSFGGDVPCWAVLTAGCSSTASGAAAGCWYISVGKLLIASAANPEADTGLANLSENCEFQLSALAGRGECSGSVSSPKRSVRWRAIHIGSCSEVSFGKNSTAAVCGPPGTNVPALTG